jgi:hypothetical protein
MLTVLRNSKWVLMVGALLSALSVGPCTAQDSMEGALKEAQHNTALEFRKQWCSLAQAAGLPVRIDGVRRTEADSALGAEKMRELLLPVARVNNAYGCFCSTGEARKEYKCP